MEGVKHGGDLPLITQRALEESVKNVTDCEAVKASKKSFIDVAEECFLLLEWLEKTIWPTNNDVTDAKDLLHEAMMLVDNQEEF